MACSVRVSLSIGCACGRGGGGARGLDGVCLMDARIGGAGFDGVGWDWGDGGVGCAKSGLVGVRGFVIGCGVGLISWRAGTKVT